MTPGRRARRALILAAVALCSGCAVVGHFQRDARMRSELDAHQFARPLDEVWPEARRLVAESGYDLVGSDREALGIPPQGALQRMLSKGYETRSLGNGKRALQTDQDMKMRRYRVEGTAIDAGHARVVFWLVQGSDQNPEESETRDTAMELALIERVEPDVAQRIAATVDQRK